MITTISDVLINVGTRPQFSVSPPPPRTNTFNSGSPIIDVSQPTPWCNEVEHVECGCLEKIAPVYIPERRFILHLVQCAETLPDCSSVAQRVGPWSWVRRWLTSPRFRFSVCVCVSKCTTPIWVVCPWGWRRVRRLSRLKDVLVVCWTDSGNGQWIVELTNVGIGISYETTFSGIPGCFCKPFGRRLSILTWVDNLSGVWTFSNNVALQTVPLHWRQKCKRYDIWKCSNMT